MIPSSIKPRGPLEVNVLKPNQRTTVITLVKHGVSQHEIHRKTGIDRKTIRKYANAEGALFGGDISNSPMATGSVMRGSEIPPPRPPGRTESSSRSIPTHARSACDGHRTWIEEQVRLKRNAQAIYQELVDQHGFKHRYNSVKRFVRALKRVAPEQFDRLEFRPGEEAQVDYGEGALTRHPTSGNYRRPRLFVMTLRYSRRSFRKVVWKSSSETWAKLHEEAFRSFGGSVQYVVLDNLKEGVIKPDIYEPELNRLYAEVLKHHGAVADPARVRDPDRKGTVENAIQHTQSTALKGKRFETIEEQNEYLSHWEMNWAAKRIHGREKRQVEAMFQEERPHLKTLPPANFRYFTEGLRTVGDDATIQVDSAWYAARPAAIGSQVIVRVYTLEVEIRDANTLALIRSHPRATRKGELKLPESERIFNPSRQTTFLLKQAESVGPKTLELCTELFEKRGREGQKSMWGIVGLTRNNRYPKRFIEQACALALEQGVRSSKSIRLTVEMLLDEAIVKLDTASGIKESALTQVHDLIRPTDEYAEHFKQSVQTQSEPQNPKEGNDLYAHVHD
jgi:transposase